MQGFSVSTLLSTSRAPLVIEPASHPYRNVESIRQYSQEVRSLLLEHGALLFRGFAVTEVADFDRFVDSLEMPRLEYLYRSTPRTSVGSRVFTATEYPPPLEIPLHNENAYQREWPLKLALCCLQPAATGGETPIADLGRITAAIGDSLLDEFERRGVRYIRHYRPHVDVPWQTVFQTDDKAQVARYCTDHGIEHEWLDAQTLRTSQVCQGVARHPQSKVRYFFNQAHLFHVSSLGPAASSLVKMYGNRLPRHACFGDGVEIPPQDLERVRDAFRREALVFAWQQGDVMLVDNMQFAHGRKPFSGPRKVVVALLESHSNEDLDS
jgi:alpha-ketoglutarate-dependent taurine dioxygenase